MIFATSPYVGFCIGRIIRAQTVHAVYEIDLKSELFQYRGTYEEPDGFVPEIECLEIIYPGIDEQGTHEQLYTSTLKYQQDFGVKSSIFNVDIHDQLNKINYGTSSEDSVSGCFLSCNLSG